MRLAGTKLAANHQYRGFGDQLYDLSGERPSLDLNFSSTKSLVDATTGQNLVTFTRASSGTYVDSQGVIRTATANEARFDHNPTTGESLGLLVEESRTNLLLLSENLYETGTGGGSWIYPSGVMSNNTQVAPDGTTTADTLTTTGGAQSIYQSATVTASTTYTGSVYVRLGTMQAGDFKVAVYNNSTPGFIAADIAPSQTPTSTGWTRISYSFTTPVGCTSVRWYPFRNSVSLGSCTVHLWGAQLEAGAFPTSYIPTTTAAATRSADVASITGTNFSSWYSQSQGTVFAETQLPAGSAVNTASRSIIDATDGSTNNRIIVRAIGSGTTADQTTVRSGAVATAQFASTGAAVSSAARKIAVVYNLDDYASWATGATSVATDTSGALPIGINQLAIGSATGSVEYLSGTIRRLTYWPQRLPNSTLQQITQ